MAASPKTAPSPKLPEGFEHRPDLRRAATSQDLGKAPRHRWFYFPHSYSPQLVHKILEYWELPENANIADNFVGSGTTLVVAREMGMKAMGYDLSPLSVMITNAKIGSYKPAQLKSTLSELLRGTDYGEKTAETPQRLERAFTEEELNEIRRIANRINPLPKNQHGFFMTSLLSTAREFSRAVPDGGWFRWKDWPDRSQEIEQVFRSNTDKMIDDVLETNPGTKSKHRRKARLADARKLPLKRQSISGLITSPPYPNRHDYSRVFHIELLLMGSTEPEITSLRHSSLRSHVEAKRQKNYENRLRRYRKPQMLEHILTSLPAGTDQRIRPMLEGYFEDIFLSLQEVHRVLGTGGQAAYIVGNVRHSGVMVPVDEIIREIAPQAGLVLHSAWVMRLRGNSAQQMGKFGREPSRESTLFLSKASDA